MGVILNRNRKTKTIKDLPGYLGSEVVVYGRVSIGDIVDAGGDNIKFVTYAIKSWNFLDEQEKPLPITVEALRGMEYTTFEYLLKEIEAFAKTQKKNVKNSTAGQ